MIVTFLVPSTKRTIGGVMALYEFANGLSRRGHDVHLVHLPFVDGHIDRIEDLAWFPFDARVEHHLSESVDLESFDAAELPSADFVEVTGLEFFAPAGSSPGVSEKLGPAAGLPFLFVQGYRIFSPQVDEHAFRVPFPKLCVAHWLVHVLLESGVPPDQVEYVPYGLDHESFRLVQPIAGRSMQVAMLYNVHPLKGAKFGLAAIEEVHRRHPQLRAVVFGNSDPAKAMPAYVRFVKLPPRTTLVEEIYNASRVFVCSSLKEGFGLCAIEAMAGGCALVTTENGGSSDYAVDGETALVCEPRDVTGMADRIEQLLSDDARRARIAQRGYESVRRFDWDASARRLEEFLERYAEDPTRFRRTADDR